jgi:hypothetical protein
MGLYYFGEGFDSDFGEHLVGLRWSWFSAKSAQVHGS